MNRWCPFLHVLKNFPGLFIYYFIYASASYLSLVPLYRSFIFRALHSFSPIHTCSFPCSLSPAKLSWYSLVLWASRQLTQCLCLLWESDNFIVGSSLLPGPPLSLNCKQLWIFVVINRLLWVVHKPEFTREIDLDMCLMVILASFRMGDLKMGQQPCKA